MSVTRGPSAIRGAFVRARGEGRAAFVAYVLAGYPDSEVATAAARAALESGADLLEIGVPFSDPVADGPVIAEAGRLALEHGAGLATALGTIAFLRKLGYEQPMLVMSYLNPLVVRGERAALAALAEAGADGLIVPDLPVGEEPSFERLAADLRLGLCFLVAPNTPPARIERAVAASTGFVYVVPLLGVTGVRERLADAALPLLERVRSVAAGRVPVAAGFGVANPDQVRTLAQVSDGVVVGSALVAALTNGGSDGPTALGDRVRELASGLPRTHHGSGSARAGTAY